MPTIRDNMIGDVARFILNRDEHAEDFEWTPEGGLTTPYVGIIERREQIGATAGMRGVEHVQMADLIIATDGVDGPATVREGDVATFDGQCYGVKGRPFDEGLGMTRVRVEWIRPAERSGRRFRET